MKQPILVLGAGGFIGRKVVAGLAATDWAEPVAATRRPGPSPAGAARQCIVEATSAASIGSALQGIRAVVNCAAPDPSLIVTSVTALFDAIGAAPAAVRVVHLSTMSVYGGASGLVDETAPLRGDLGEYSAAKVAAEGIAANCPKTVIFRPGCVYGPGSTQWSRRFGDYLVARRLGDLGASGDGYCNLVHVEDVVTAILRALQNPPPDGRVYNLSSPNPPTWNDYLTRYALALHAVPVRRISARRLKVETKLLAPPLKIAEILLRAARVGAGGLPPPIPPSLARLMRQEIKLDVRRAESELGLRWRDLDAGLSETAKWFLESGKAA